MSNALYDPGRELFLESWLQLDIRVMLVKRSYLFKAAHRYISSLADADNGRSASLTGKTALDGIADADDITIVAKAGVPCDSLVIYQNSGNDATSRVIAYVNSAITGLPFTPTVGQKMSIVWSNGKDRIFKL